jgi:hypothetical protein
MELSELLGEFGYLYFRVTWDTAPRQELMHPV